MRQDKNIILQPIHTSPIKIITKALANRYDSISNIIFLKRMDTDSLDTQLILINDAILINTKQEVIESYLKKKSSKQIFSKQIDYLKFHTEFPKEKRSTQVFPLMHQYNKKRRMLKFIRLSKILNIQIENEAFSITSLMLEMQGRNLKITQQNQLDFQKPILLNCQQKSTYESIFKKTVIKGKSKQKSKQKVKTKGIKPRSKSKRKIK